MFRLNIAVTVPETLAKLSDTKGGDLSQTCSVTFDPKKLPVVSSKSLLSIDPMFFLKDETRYRCLRLKMSSNKMPVGDKTKDVPIMLFDNSPDSTGIVFDITSVADPVNPKQTFSVDYVLDETNGYPKIPPNSKYESTDDKNVSICKATVDEIHKEPWIYVGSSFRISTTHSDSKFQAVIHTRLVANPETKEPLIVFYDRMYGLFGLELMIDETVFGLTKDSCLDTEELEPSPCIIKGKDIDKFCEKHPDHPKPPSSVPIYPDGNYVPVDKSILSGGPLISNTGAMMGMVMFPGWARLFEQKDIDLINEVTKKID